MSYPTQIVGHDCSWKSCLSVLNQWGCTRSLLPISMIKMNMAYNLGVVLFPVAGAVKAAVWRTGRLTVAGDQREKEKICISIELSLSLNSPYN